MEKPAIAAADPMYPSHLEETPSKLFLTIFQTVIDMSSYLPITQKVDEKVGRCVHKLKQIDDDSKNLKSNVVFVMMPINRMYYS